MTYRVECTAKAWTYTKKIHTIKALGWWQGEREKQTNTLYKTEMSTIAGQSCSCICLYEFEWAPCSRVTKLQLEVEGSLVAGGTGGEDGTIVSFRYVEWSPGDGWWQVLVPLRLAPIDRWFKRDRGWLCVLFCTISISSSCLTDREKDQSGEAYARLGRTKVV